MIPLELKKRCVEQIGRMSYREIYEKIFLPEHDAMGFKCFRSKLHGWKNQQMADETTLEAGTYPGFTPHAATVQVNSEGRITQTWIKQTQEIDWQQIREIVCDGAPRSEIIPATVSGETMLEIPLFDMHFGVATMDTYREALAELLGIVKEKNYDEINILIGQDVLHNNDMRGHTAKGTPIDKVDFRQAWTGAWSFFCTLIDAALEHTPRVRLLYSKGNHDECTAWCLFKALQAVYPQAESDDSLAPRKCIFWKGCFVGFGHCEYTTKSSLLFQNFVLDFPEQFASAKVREIHSGHLHRESVDEGIMVRRLPSAVPTDEWSSNNGYTGAHKRFQIFEWAEGRLKAIYYL